MADDKVTTKDLLTKVMELQRQMTAQERAIRVMKKASAPSPPPDPDDGVDDTEESLEALRKHDARMFRGEESTEEPARPRSRSSGKNPIVRVPKGSDRPVKQPKQVDPFVVECLRRGIKLTDIDRAAEQYRAGNETKFTAMCDAYIATLLAKQMSQQRVWWCVIPDFDFDARTVEGKRLVDQGLADCKWVKNYREYLDALHWKEEQEARVRGANKGMLRDTDSPVAKSGNGDSRKRK